MAETGFEIGDETYPVPTLDSLNMDEAQVLYDYSSLVVEDFLPPRPDLTEDEKGEIEAALGQKMRNPGLLRALMHIAYQRGNPGQKPAKVKELIGKANMTEALLSLASLDDTEDDSLPPAQTPEPERQSPSGSGGSNTNSGAGSENASAQPEETLDGIGATRSGTSPTAARKLSVA